MADKYIADVIPNYEIQDWKLGDKIIINAPTGSGKSYFVINVLSKHAKASNNKILLLTNRKILKEQVEADIGNDSYIKVINYQGLTRILKESNYNIKKYKYVVCDECHFFFTDSYFNAETDISLEYLTNLENNITLFLSATCEIFKDYMKKKNPRIYGLSNELNYDKLYYFNDSKTVVKLLDSLPENEKAIYFCSNINKAYSLHKQFEDRSAFICSQSGKNKKYVQLSDVNTRQQIIDDAKFEQQILFTTKILDNGVNIKDEQLKHIVIDIFDFDTIQQCIGRKRILNDDDKINVYIKLFNQRSVQSFLNQWNSVIKFGDDFQELEQDEYLKKHGRKNTNGLVYTKLKEDGTYELKLNEAYYYKLNYDIADCKTIKQWNKDNDSKLGHLQILCDRYGIQLKEFQCLEDVVTTDTFNEQLERYLGIKMFKDEQKQFKEFIKDNAVKTVDKRNGALGINTINGYFRDNDIKYLLESEQETKGENRKKRYWQLYKLV